MPIDAPTLWIIMMVIGAGTFLIRFSFIWLFGLGEVHPAVQRALRLVPPSVLSALVLPSIVFPQQAAFSMVSPRLWAGVIAALVAWRTKNVLYTIVSGMASLWLFSLL